jgi:hypothetical protein
MYPPPKIFTTPIYPPSQNLAKTSPTLPLEFQTVCIYDFMLQKKCASSSFKLKVLQNVWLFHPI